MKQDKILEATKKAIELPLEFTQKVMEKTEKVRNPSPRVDKIGRSIGKFLGALLFLAGAVLLLAHKPLWGITSLLAGAATIISNIIRFSGDKK